MCISPGNVWIKRGSETVQIPRACGACWRCKQNRVNDYVARAMAESATSQTSCTISLTYAPRDDLADKVLHPRHFQLFMKLLRRAGHKVRYLVAGEYGELKGRAHFHALLFFQHIAPLDGPAPAYGSHDAPFCREIPHKRMVHIREWPHGHISVDWSASEQSARYVCKYLLADDKNNAWFSLSKKPALGAAWFAQKAAKAVELGVLPASFNYLPPGGNRDRPYMLTGASRRDYMNAITQDPERREVMSEWVQKTFDKHHVQRVLDAWEYSFPTSTLYALQDRLYLINRGIEVPRRLELYVELLRDLPSRGFDYQANWTSEQREYHDTFVQKIAESYVNSVDLDGKSRSAAPVHLSGGRGQSSVVADPAERSLSELVKASHVEAWIAYQHGHITLDHLKAIRESGALWAPSV